MSRLLFPRDKGIRARPRLSVVLPPDRRNRSHSKSESPLPSKERNTMRPRGGHPPMTPLQPNYRAVGPVLELDESSRGRPPDLRQLPQHRLAGRHWRPPASLAGHHRCYQTAPLLDLLSAPFPVCYCCCRLTRQRLKISSRQRGRRHPAAADKGFPQERQWKTSPTNRLVCHYRTPLAGDACQGRPPQDRQFHLVRWIGCTCLLIPYLSAYEELGNERAHARRCPWSMLVC